MASCGRVNMAICCCNSPGRRSSGAHKEAKPVGCQFKTPVSAVVERSGGKTQYQACQVKSLSGRGGGSVEDALWPFYLLLTTLTSICCCILTSIPAPKGGDNDRTKRQYWWKWDKGLWSGSTTRWINSTSHTQKWESWGAHPFWDQRLHKSSVKSPSMPERNL